MSLKYGADSLVNITSSFLTRLPILKVTEVMIVPSVVLFAMVAFGNMLVFDVFMTASA